MSFAARAGTGSLERELQWALGLVAVLVLLALTGGALWIGREATEQFIASRLAHDAEALIAGLDPANAKVERPLPPVYSQPFSGHYYWVLLDDGRVARSRSWWDHPFDPAAVSPGETALEIKSGPRDQRLLLWRAGYEKDGMVFTVGVAEDLTPLTQALHRWLRLALGLCAAGVLTLLLVQRWFLRRGFRQITAVREDVRRLGDGEVERLREQVPAEVQPLVRELNQFIDAWRNHLQRSRQALGNLAHALKSPLNLILLRCPEGPQDPVAAQAVRMRELIDRELRRARLTGDALPGRRFRPHADIPDLIAGVRTLYEDKELHISLEIDAPEKVPYDQEDMLELFGNLLDNAAKWAGHRIRVSTRFRGGLQVLIEDDGPGVEPAAAEKLAARGSRLDESTPGHGLGLSIVQEILRIHGGRLRFGRSERLGGFEVRVDLPGPQGVRSTLSERA